MISVSLFSQILSLFFSSFFHFFSSFFSFSVTFTFSFFSFSGVQNAKEGGSTRDAFYPKRRGLGVLPFWGHISTLELVKRAFHHSRLPWCVYGSDVFVIFASCTPCGLEEVARRLGDGHVESATVRLDIGSNLAYFSMRSANDGLGNVER